MINTLSSINEAAKDPGAFIKKCEKEYRRTLNKISKRILGSKDCKIVTLAGPSASGKTTTAHILEQLLEEAGVTAEVVSLDDFYLETENQPLLPDGKRDIESVNALDTELIKKCFGELIENGKSRLPKFDFTNERRIPEHHTADITGGGVIIVEGLHALNPLITDCVPRENVLKLYVSVSEPIYAGGGEVLLTSTQIRLARRMIRDIKFRNSPVSRTLELWSGVMAEETRSLYRYKDNADIVIASLHPYEVCVYHDLLDEVDLYTPPKTPNYDYYVKTVEALQKFAEIDDVLVPYDSLLREFVGGGKYN